MKRARVFFLILVAGTPFGTDMASAQGLVSLDRWLFDRIYDIERPAFRDAMRLADATAYPVFTGGAIVAWVGAVSVRGGGEGADAYRLALSELGALAGTFGLKYLVRRTRPYVRYPDVDSRTGDIARYDPWSFPSGHAALAFAMATSYSLSHPAWYVIVPGYLWAASVSVSRVWLGVHYPSDVLVGALLGGLVGLAVHRLGPSITPQFLEGDDAQGALVHVRVSF